MSEADDAGGRPDDAGEQREQHEEAGGPVPDGEEYRVEMRRETQLGACRRSQVKNWAGCSYVTTA